MSKKQEATTSIKLIRTAYDYFQVLSLDVVVGSILVSYFFAQLSNASFDFGYHYFLGLAVWLVYTVDHLIDAYKIKGEAITFRHRFHQQYFRKIVWVWSVVFVGSSIGVWYFLPSKVIQLGVIVGVIVIAHLLLVIFLWEKVSKLIQKEIGVGMGYTLGVLLLPYLYGTDLGVYFHLASLQLFVLVMINIYLFSFFDEEKDRLQGQTSMVRSVGNSGLVTLIHFLFTTTSILVLITTVIYSNEIQYQAVFFLMLLALFSIYYFEKYFATNDRYRILGDGVFLFPLIYCFYEWL